VLPITHFDSIILGIILGVGGFNFLIETLNSTIIGLAGLFCFIIVCQLPQMDQNSFLLILSYSLVGISTTLILISVMNNDNLKKIFSNKILVYLGKRSYGLYVYHLILIKAGETVLTKVFNIQNQSFLWFAFSLTCTIIVSILSYSIIEKPFLKIKKKFQVINSRPI
jgi:peptidoglycan/LPS O-acetylase OafA/YrhL